MTRKFTTPCFISKNTPKLRKKLEELGYIYDKTNLLDISQYPCLYTYWHPNLEELYSGIGAYVNNTINCRTNEELFLAIAALRDDTDKNQWFVMDVEVYENIPKDCWFKATDIDGGKHIGTQINPLYCHKATVEELIEYFKAE